MSIDLDELKAWENECLNKKKELSSMLIGSKTSFSKSDYDDLCGSLKIINKYIKIVTNYVTRLYYEDSIRLEFLNYIDTVNNNYKKYKDYVMSQSLTIDLIKNLDNSKKQYKKNVFELKQLGQKFGIYKISTLKHNLLYCKEDINKTTKLGFLNYLEYIIKEKKKLLHGYAIHTRNPKFDTINGKVQFPFDYFCNLEIMEKNLDKLSNELKSSLDTRKFSEVVELLPTFSKMFSKKITSRLANAKKQFNHKMSVSELRMLISKTLKSISVDVTKESLKFDFGHPYYEKIKKIVFTDSICAATLDMKSEIDEDKAGDYAGFVVGLSIGILSTIFFALTAGFGWIVGIILGYIFAKVGGRLGNYVARDLVDSAHQIKLKAHSHNKKIKQGIDILKRGTN